jgi:hypothetical protein
MQGVGLAIVLGAASSAPGAGGTDGAEGQAVGGQEASRSELVESQIAITNTPVAS